MGSPTIGYRDYTPSLATGTAVTLEHEPTDLSATISRPVVERERETERDRERQREIQRETERETEKLTLTPFIVKATDPHTRRELG